MAQQDSYQIPMGYAGIGANGDANIPAMVNARPPANTNAAGNNNTGGGDDIFQGLMGLLKGYENTTQNKGLHAALNDFNSNREATLRALVQGGTLSPDVAKLLTSMSPGEMRDHLDAFLAQSAKQDGTKQPAQQTDGAGKLPQVSVPLPSSKWVGNGIQDFFAGSRQGGLRQLSAQPQQEAAPPMQELRAIAGLPPSASARGATPGDSAQASLLRSIARLPPPMSGSQQ